MTDTSVKTLNSLEVPSGRTLWESDLEIVRQMHKAGSVYWSDAPITLRSGGISHVYCRGREDFTTSPELLALIAEAAMTHVWDEVEGAIDNGCCLIGVPSAGTAIAAWMSASDTYMHQTQSSTEFLVMRQAKKAHGVNTTWVDGKPTVGKKIILVENVRTTGGSEDEAIAKLAEDGIDTSALVRFAIVSLMWQDETEARKSLFYLADIIYAFGILGLWPEEQVQEAMKEFGLAV